MAKKPVPFSVHKVFQKQSQIYIVAHDPTNVKFFLHSTFKSFHKQYVMLCLSCMEKRWQVTCKQSCENGSLELYLLLYAFDYQNQIFILESKHLLITFFTLFVEISIEMHSRYFSILMYDWIHLLHQRDEVKSGNLNEL